MRERLEALKAEWEVLGACAFPWDELILALEELDTRVAAIESAGGKNKALQSIDKRVAALEDAATKPTSDIPATGILGTGTTQKL